MGLGVILKATEHSQKLGFVKRSTAKIWVLQELRGRDQPKPGEKLLLRGKMENAEADLGKDPFEITFAP